MNKRRAFWRTVIVILCPFHWIAHALAWAFSGLWYLIGVAGSFASSKYDEARRDGEAA